MSFLLTQSFLKMNPYQRNKCRKWPNLSEDDAAQLMFEIWIHYLRKNEGDHLHTLYDIEYARDVYEMQEEYEICAVLHHVIEQYPRLSQLKLQ